MKKHVQTRVGIILSTLSIVGAILNAMLMWQGFVLWIIANIGWIWYNVQTKMYEQIPIWVVFTITSTSGLIYWVVL